MRETLEAFVYRLLQRGVALADIEAAAAPAKQDRHVRCDLVPWAHKVVNTIMGETDEG